MSGFELLRRGEELERQTKVMGVRSDLKKKPDKSMGSLTKSLGR